MKRFSERRKPGQKPYRGYLAPCPRCGLIVVHADSTLKPFHMHARSKKCRELAEKVVKEKGGK